MIHYGIDQGAGPVPGTGMDNHTPRLVYNKKIFIFIYYLYRYILRDHIELLRLRERYPDNIAFSNSTFLGYYRLSVDADSAFFDELYRITPGKFICIPSDKCIKPGAAVFG